MSVKWHFFGNEFKSMSSKTTPFILEVFFCQKQLAGPIEEHVKIVHTTIWSKGICLLDEK